MPSIQEALNSGPLHDALMAGLGDISQQATIPFLTYQKTVLPLDGFVFWLLSGQTSASGMLHWMGEREQLEDETPSRNSVLFSTDAELQPLNQKSTTTLVVGEIEGRKYAFSRIGYYASQAGIWHYQGDAVNATVQTQLVHDPAKIDPTKLIVSDSLPAWLSLYSYNPIYLQPLNPGIMLYPSFLIPDNLDPPYGAVHIEPDSIRAIQPIPHWGRHMTQHQLVSERVRVTLYGCNNDMAEDFLALVLKFSEYTDVIGIMGGTTAVRDEKYPWVAGMVIAQKKVIDFEISYHQTRVNDLARQLILEACASVLTRDMVFPLASLSGAASIWADAEVISGGHP